MTFLDPMLSAAGRSFQLVNVEKGTVLASRLQGAFESAARNRGLLGRSGLPAGEALVIAPSNSIHMFFMRFAIDAVFVARDGRVVKTCADLRPWRIALAWRAFAVVECPVGTVEASGTRPGDRLAVVPEA